MPLQCWKSEGRRITRLQALILLPCLLVISLWVGGGRTMADSEIKELRYENKSFPKYLADW